ncbi:MAG: thioesterase family protein, partial [Stackebrandtia sp.]
AWTTTEQHISPMNGLITHAVERFCAERGADAMAINRISVDILGVLGIDEFTVDVEVVRPGRTIELLEVVVVAAGRPAVRARVWRSVVQDTTRVTGGADDPLPGPETVENVDLTGVWPGGYIRSLRVRPVGTPKPGRGTVWVATDATLVSGEPVSDLARLIGLVDTANGLSVRESPDSWLFPNLDLTIHLFRQPGGTWLGLDTTVVFGPAGHGVTSTALHDSAGQFGFAQQALTIRPRAA